MKYFSKNSFLFLKELKKNNNRLWFQENKQKYIEYIKEPILEITKTLEKKYGEAHIFRQNRDLRFSKDKSPYKSHASFVIEDGNIAPIYFEFSENGILLAGGIYDIEKDQLNRWRNLFTFENQNVKFRNVELSKINSIKSFISKAKLNGFELMEDGSLKSAPRGFSKDNPDIYFINLKHIVLSKSYVKNDWMLDCEMSVKLKGDLKILEEWNSILKKYIGFTNIKKVDFKKISKKGS